jgi:CheY-like chemotaxis protein
MIVPNRSHITVLAIDYEKDALAQLSEVLGGAGYLCHCARDAGTAAEAVRRARPDLIISDINLAGYDGLTICEQLKHDAGLDHVPVMFLSAAQAVDVMRRSNTVGGTYYLRKPFDARVLLELVARALPLIHVSRG